MTLRRRAVPTAVIAILALAAAAPSAHADQVTAALSQQQSNRLSILHDYGLDLVGDSTGDGAGPAGHAAGGYLGEVPLVGTPGQGAAAAILTKVSSKLTFLQGIQSTDDTPTGRNFDLSLGYASGYDSNPKANPYARDGSFIAGTFTAGYHLVDGPDDPVIGSAFRADVAYNVVAVAYSGPRADADGVQQGLNGSVRDSLLGDRLVATGSVNDQFTMEHGEAFLNTTDVAAAAEAFATYHLSVEGGYDYAHLQYFFRPVDDAQKPTAERHSLDARVHFYPVSQERGVGIPNTDAGLGLFVEQAPPPGDAGLRPRLELPRPADRHRLPLPVRPRLRRPRRADPAAQHQAVRPADRPGHLGVGLLRPRVPELRLRQQPHAGRAERHRPRPPPPRQPGRADDPQQHPHPRHRPPRRHAGHVPPGRPRPRRGQRPRPPLQRADRQQRLELRLLTASQSPPHRGGWAGTRRGAAGLAAAGR